MPPSVATVGTWASPDAAATIASALHPPHPLFAVVFALLGLGFAALAARTGVAGAALGWAAITAILVAAAYARGAPSLFGKRDDGSLPAWRRALLLPYHAIVVLVCQLQRSFSREPAWHAVADGVYLGRFPRKSESPGEVTLVVDLTAELPRRAEGSFAYVLVPTLDGCSPPVEELDRLARLVAAHDGVAYVHCAAGHGRSATVVAAALALRGSHGSLDEVIAHLRAVRPGVFLNGVQRGVLSAWWASRDGERVVRQG